MIGVVLAGGKSLRFGGSPKGLIDLDRRPMALHVASTLQTICTAVFIEAAPEADYEALNLPIIRAQAAHTGKGPLAGIVAGLNASEGPVAFAPCDMPMLTPAVFHTLRKRAEIAKGAYARTPSGLEPLVAVLRLEMREPLLRQLDLPRMPRTHAALDAAGAAQVEFSDISPFANINTPADLERLSLPGR